MNFWETTGYFLGDIHITNLTSKGNDKSEDNHHYLQVSTMSWGESEFAIKQLKQLIAGQVLLEFNNTGSRDLILEWASTPTTERNSYHGGITASARFDVYPRPRE